MISVHEESTWPDPPAPFNLAQHVLAAAGALAAKPALEILGAGAAGRFSYASLAAAVRGTGTGLLRAGLRPGDRILLRLGNTADFPLAFLGAVAVGVLPVPAAALLTRPEVAALIAHLAPRLVLADPRLALPETPCPVIGTDELRRWRDLELCPFDLGSPDRPAYIVLTSGTSGQASAVVHAHRAIWARGMMRAGWDGIGRTDRVLHAGAFNWTFTLGTGLLDPWSMGATALIPAEGNNAADLPGLIARHEATIFAAAPVIYRRMLADCGPVGGVALRHGLSAGEKLSPELRTAWIRATGRPIHEALGMSECSTFVSGSPMRPAPEGAVGYSQPGRKVAVLGTDGQPVPRGTPGELAVADTDPGLFLGYHRAEAETRSFFSGRWFRTGDSVVMAGDGAVTYLGRLDEMMNAGGVRVSPLEVEAALAACPGLGEVAVAEVTVKAGTSVIAAFYTARGALAETQLAAFASSRLARYKCPKIWARLDAIPRTATGKTDRSALRALDLSTKARRE